MSLFDASAWVGMWPFTASAPTSLAELAGSLGRVGISGAAVSPIAAVLGPEPMASNRALLDEARAVRLDGFAVTVVPVLDPTLPGWEDDLDSLLADHASLIGAIKLVPNYHGYGVDGPQAIAAVRAISAAGLGVCVQMRLLDERAHHPLMVVPGVPVDAVARLAAAVPEVRILACGIYQAELAEIAGPPNVSVEVSAIESGDVLSNVLAALDARRVLLGTHAPIHYPAPSVAKVTNTASGAEVEEQIGNTNAQRFFGCKGAFHER